jgi:hypothetical protein
MVSLAFVDDPVCHLLAFHFASHLPKVESRLVLFN